MPVLLATGCGEDRTVATPPTPQPPAGWIDVQLAPEGQTVTLGADGPAIAIDARGRELVRFADDDMPLHVDARGVRLGARALGAPPVEIRPVGRAVLAVDGAPYRGWLRVEAGGLLNRLPLEEYLLGVVPCEMPESFGLEALKAQAVAARTYALHSAAADARLLADERSQVYRGRAAETLVATRAVRQTAGEVLTARGAPIPAWYHSTCGGSTTPAQHVFPFAPDGLLDVPRACDACVRSPYHRWVRRFDAAAVCAAVDLPPAPLEAIDFEPRELPGRPRRVTVVAGGLAATRTASSFRSRLSAGRPREQQALSTYWVAPPRLEQGELVLAGGGWGHGVGMCQWGAGGYAARGEDHLTILARYYPGAQLELLP